MKIHIVQPGETLESVAERYGISVEKLLQANELNELDSLEAGMKVRIPAGRVPVTQQNSTSEPTAEPPNRMSEPPKKEYRPPKKEYRPPKKEHRPPKKEHRPPKKEYRPPRREYPCPSSSSWSSPDRSPRSPRWESPEYWETPRRYPYPMGDERYPEPGYPRPKVPWSPERHHPGCPDPRRPMVPPMPQTPVYPWNPCWYPFPPCPMMPMPYPMMYPPAYPPMMFPDEGMESDFMGYNSMTSWEGSARTQEVDDGSSSTDMWDSQGN